IAAPRLTKIIDEQLVPGTMLAFSAINTGLSVPGCGDALYYCEPTEGQGYMELDDIFDSCDYESGPKTGTWRYYDVIIDEDEFGEWYVVGQMKAIITRNIVNDEDQILFNLRLEKLNGELLGTYTGEFRYPTADWDKLEKFMEGPDEFPDKIEHEDTFDDYITLSVHFELPGNIKGDVNLNGFVSHTFYLYIFEDEWTFMHESNNILHAINGVADGNFTFNGGNYSFDGELNLDFTNGETDYFNGTINLPDALIQGDMEIYYVSNPNQTQPLLEGAAIDLVPKRLELDGSFKDKKSDLEMTGDLTLEFKQAESFVYHEPYSEGNWPELKLSFDGKLFNENNDSLIGTLTFEETAYKRFMINIGYDLKTDGIPRTIGLNAWMVSDQQVALEITSDWGPAAMNMDLTFSPYFIDIQDGDLIVGELDTLSGKVLVQGVEVGKISLTTDLGVKVEYKDGSFETF
ncbi:MAG: hypothetical protein GX770_00670, partial [Firmicutes bacterium]|nr:hypothetical protein [Bacillota bacterium]